MICSVISSRQSYNLLNNSRKFIGTSFDMCLVVFDKGKLVGDKAYQSYKAFLMQSCGPSVISTTGLLSCERPALGWTLLASASRRTMRARAFSRE